MISDRRGVSRRLVVSATWLKAAVFLGIVCAILAAAMAVDYVGLLVQSVENKKLRVENIQLRNQFKVIEGKLAGLETGLDRVQNFTTKLRLITDTADDNKALKLTVTPQHHNSGTDVLEDREPASIPEQESVFFQKPLLDSEVGELAATPETDYAVLSIRLDRALKETVTREQTVLELLDLLSDRQSLLRSTPSILPARGWFTSTFGYRINPVTGAAVLHAGLDIASNPGTPIHAPADGVVAYAGYDAGYGKLISIDHGYGVVTRYGHNSQIFVVVGQKVKRGDVIGAVGMTGRTTGPHLHYEVRLNDVPVDPMNYILTE